MEQEPSIDRTTNEPVYRQSFSALQMHVLDQLIHAAALKQVLASASLSSANCSGSSTQR